LPTLAPTKESKFSAGSALHWSKCAKAAAAFKTRDFAAALAAYEEAQSILKLKWDDKFDDLKLRVDRNLAITYGKLSNWKESLTHADKVLRKAEAHVQLGQFDDARKALDKGLAATKSDPAGQAESQTTRAEREPQRRQDGLFKKIVQKGVGD
jgi:tetratricopeptide (TPR) repeat protein